MLGAVEGGGTKFVCAVGRDHDSVEREMRIETRDPEATLAAVVAFLAGHRIGAVGLASFGPVALDGERAGTMLSTPKPGWSGFAFGPRLRDALGVPVAVDTDVNAAALAEARLGAGRGFDPVLYVTVGTGIGGGLVANGLPVHGLLHPELGHLPVPVLDSPDGEPDAFEGVCPFHGRCLEGVASGPALAARLGHGAEMLPDDAPLLSLVARYVGHALASAVLVASPQRVVVGGGVGGRAAMLPVIESALTEALGGYVPAPPVVAPGLGARAGLVGAFLLAAQAA